MPNNWVSVIKNGSSHKAELIKAAIFDCDGVLTDSRVLEGLLYEGRPFGKPKWRSYYDGQGISLLRAIGIRVCVITNESEGSAAAIHDMVSKWNHLPSTDKWGKVGLFVGCGGARKVTAAEGWLRENKISDWEECAFMGDDLVDIPLLKVAGLKVAPASAEQAVKDLAHLITVRPGGAGAVRDFANFVLHVRGIDPLSLPTE